MDDLRLIADFAAEISVKAGDILLKGFRSPETRISYKSRSDLVTNIDRESEDFLFKSVKNEFSSHSIIAEEGSRRYADGEFLWYIDPLDATNNFAHGVPFFCVSIGIYSKELERGVAGVVYDPCHKELFMAIKGDGSFLNGERVHVSQVEEIGSAVLATGFPSEKSDTYNNNSKEFSVFLPRSQAIRRIGSAALDLCYVACGRFDGYWEPKLKPWDMAGGAVIVEEAGGIVTDYNNGKFDPELPEILASNGKIHKDMLEILRSV